MRAQILLALVAILTTTPIAVFAQEPEQEPKVYDVIIGDGSTPDTQKFTYTPSNFSIQVGEAVRWTSPAQVVDLHTVTIIQDNETISDIVLPFATNGSSSSVGFELLPPFTVGEPITFPSGEDNNATAIVGLNKVAWYPSIVNLNQTVTYAPEGERDVYVALNNTVRVANSGVILPSSAQQNQTEVNSEDMPPAPFPAINSYTVTFQDAGDYIYFCGIHPWMTGQVSVVGPE